jgi:hypothetical protein
MWVSWFQAFALSNSTGAATARVQTRGESKRAKEVQTKLARVRKKRKAVAPGAVGAVGAGAVGAGVAVRAGAGAVGNVPADLAAVEAALVAEAAAGLYKLNPVYPYE